MNCRKITFPTALILWTFLRTASGGQTTKAEDPTNCTLFVAPSTIPGAGLGIFTSIPREKNSIIGVGDVIIPLYDTAIESDLRQFDEYTWEGVEMGMSSDAEDGTNVYAFSPGLGAIINAHSALNNVYRMDHPMDTTLPHRSKYPTVGSMTPYWNTSTHAIRHIPANSELFKDYGEVWFTERTHLLGLVPLKKHYMRVTDVLQKMNVLFTKHGPMKEPLKKDLFHVATSFQSRLAKAFPALEEMDQVLQTGMVQHLQPKHQQPDLLTMPEARCLENLVPGVSSIEGAGRGAFARCDFQKGQVITGSPIIHISNKSHLDIFHPELLLERTDKSGVFGKQLLINYCWSHPRTSLLLCPYGAGVNLINHSKEQANVMIEWSPNGHLGHRDSSLKRSVSQMRNSMEPRLAFDFVALRDIREGEELFLDYGDDWIKAWNLHVAKWMPDTRSDYKTAAELNKLLNDSLIRTDEEQKRNPYPTNVQLVCHKNIQEKEYQPQNLTWDYFSNEIKCNVKDRVVNKENVTSYTVTIGKSKLTQVARSLIRFKDKKKSTDIHLTGAFRQPLSLPNHMLPTAWQNL